uniref:Pyruvate kinase n=1 Tax=Timspurckia oligopyrenoides TaxID=708627 RepID=A0A7S0ZL37_9RHOD
MIARGDLGTAIPFEQVPTVQEKIVNLCRSLGKPCLISTHFLESMTCYPTPTRAEVADITEAVYQGADALILTSETASGRFPFRSLSTMHAVTKRIEEHMADRKLAQKVVKQPSVLKMKHATNTTAFKSTFIAEKLASSAAVLSDQRNAKAILVFTQKGLMANLLSRNRPRAPIVAFTAAPAIRNKLSILYGVRPLQITFLDNSEDTIQSAFNELKLRKVVEKGDMVVVVADVLGGTKGSPKEDIEIVFEEFSRGSGVISQGRVRAALRRLGLKVSDAVEAALGMRDFDLEESTRMELAASKNTTAAPVEQTVDFQRFCQYVEEATEVVHTLQLRCVE